MIELLVVISIIALLIGILLPALGAARAAGYESVCMSNLRQFGMASRIYVDQNKGYMPSERGVNGRGDGDTAANRVGNWDDAGFWINALPPLVDDRSYYDMQQDEMARGATLPRYGIKSIFVCPSCSGISGNGADPVTPDGYFKMYGTPTTGAGVEQRKTYFCYVFNSKLNNTTTNIREQHIDQGAVSPCYLPFLVEKMMMKEEVPTYAGNLCRIKTTNTRFTTRHNSGGNLLFMDGHVGYIKRTDLFPQGDITPSDYPIPGRVVWDPSVPNPY